jgi:hypothetical protein
LISILGTPKNSRMEAKVVSQDSPKPLDRLRAEIRVRHYSLQAGAGDLRGGFMPVLGMYIPKMGMCKGHPVSWVHGARVWLS